MLITEQQIPAFRRGYRLQWEQAQDCHVILYPEGMAKLNESATAILQLVDGVRSVAALIAELNAQFPDAGGVDDDVKEFFGQAYEQKWIIFREPA
ncbi:MULTISPECIES: pyrroloquinoline quinone biosynthesis peptide chaperone PqqD [Erwiniaceae]|jgi:pyrroloquinoline quinone biosynthesis protein D|uniref:PqqA binding protein n=1 Tax=Erwinia billingiae (strain Eb661) TaxID=634500 RepID=D8MWU8_ERWBE|nr:pyrroloquinoline quinone biosynthesis peptide chaperone PqqD [Erwinia billingiae]CAX61305.1 Pyrroloquinoline quinone biosynthesis protein D [Erwinia billingiae Eb661]